MYKWPLVALAEAEAGYSKYQHDYTGRQLATFFLTPKRDACPHLDVCGGRSHNIKRYLPLLFFQLVLH